MSSSGLSSGPPNPSSTNSAAPPASEFPLEDEQVQTASNEEIIAACTDAPRLGPSVIRLSRNVAVKYNKYIYLHEARNMELVAANTSVRVPRVLRAFEVPMSYFGASLSGFATFIVMEYIHGTALDDKCWDDLSESRRDSICNQVADAITELQSVKLDRPGPTGGGKSMGFWFQDGAGPFKSTSDMEIWFTRALDVCKKFKRITGVSDDEPPFTGRLGNLVMSHMDLAPRNIILEEGDKVCLIDWDFAGGYPKHFERAFLMEQHRCEDFTNRLLAKLETHEEEIKELERVRWAIVSNFFFDRDLRTDGVMARAVDDAKKK